MPNTDQIQMRALPTTTLVLGYEGIIDRPPAHVWPLLFKYNQWNPQHIGAKVVRVSGDPEQEGEVLLESKRFGDDYLAPIAIEIVTLIPYKKLVWKLYEPTEPPETLSISFVDFTLEEVGETTRFIYNSYSEILREKVGALPSEAEYRRTVAQIFDALRAYAETR